MHRAPCMPARPTRPARHRPCKRACQRSHLVHIVMACPAAAAAQPSVLGRMGLPAARPGRLGVDLL